MIKKMLLCFNTALLMATVILAVSWVKPLLPMAHATEDDGSPPDPITCPIRIDMTQSCAPGTYQRDGQIYNSCITSGTGCCQYQTYNNDCVYYREDGTEIIMRAGNDSWYRYYKETSQCQNGNCTYPEESDPEGPIDRGDDDL